MKKNRNTAGLLGIFLGAYGAHHFYYGNTNKGLLYLLLSLFTGICGLIFGIMGIVEGIQYLSMTDEEFQTYVHKNTENEQETTTPNDYLVDVLKRYNLLKQFKELNYSEVLTDDEFSAIKLYILGEQL